MGTVVPGLLSERPNRIAALTIALPVVIANIPGLAGIAVPYLVYDVSGGIAEGRTASSLLQGWVSHSEKSNAKGAE